MSKKRYYIPEVDNIHQPVETPASKERTERNRFKITIIISIISAVASIVAAIASVIACLS